MNFDELLKIASTLNSVKGEECMICHFPIDENGNMVKLSCNHLYHHNCINYLVKNNIIICPYCQIKTNMNKITKSKPKLLKTSCTTILKTGKNKGNICNRKNCMIHNKNLEV
jgi:hypothetical protein